MDKTRQMFKGFEIDFKGDGFYLLSHRYGNISSNWKIVDSLEALIKLSRLGLEIQLCTLDDVTEMSRI